MSTHINFFLCLFNPFPDNQATYPYGSLQYPCTTKSDSRRIRLVAETTRLQYFNVSITPFTFLPYQLHRINEACLLEHFISQMPPILLQMTLIPTSTSTSKSSIRSQPLARLARRPRRKSANRKSSRGYL